MPHPCSDAGALLLTVSVAGPLRIATESDAFRLSGSFAAPVEPSDATTVLTSLWQANLVGIRAERFITWGKARSTAVDRITSAAYVA